jgi:hypothetical protein
VYLLSKIVKNNLSNAFHLEVSFLRFAGNYQTARSHIARVSIGFSLLASVRFLTAFKAPLNCYSFRCLESLFPQNRCCWTQCIHVLRCQLIRTGFVQQYPRFRPFVKAEPQLSRFSFLPTICQFIILLLCPELSCFWALSVVPNSKSKKTQRFGNWICLRP